MSLSQQQKEYIQAVANLDAIIEASFKEAGDFPEDARLIPAWSIIQEKAAQRYGIHAAHQSVRDADAALFAWAREALKSHPRWNEVKMLFEPGRGGASQFKAIELLLQLDESSVIVK